MGSLEFIVKLVSAIAWPACLLIVLFFLREPVRRIVPLLERIKYKDFEVRFFRQRLKVVRQSVPTDVSTTKQLPGKDSELLKLADISPRAAIQGAWHEIEVIAETKLRELYPGKCGEATSTQDALRILECSGVLIPSTAKALQEMSWLRNEAVHSDDFALSVSDASDYISVARSIRLQIEGITELPRVRLQALTLLILQINHLIDTKKYSDIGVDEISEEIKRGTVLRFLHDRAKGDFDLTTSLDNDFEQYYAGRLQQIYNAYSGDERRKWGVENIGLCLLLAWTNEIIQ